jgi:hypothetical protein
MTTPTRPRADVVSSKYGVVNALYTRYASVPSGDSAIAA